MPPIRRYLRISKYSVLECRIFLENPADSSRWLLNPTDPALSRVFEAVKPLVLPKLREENEREKGKGKKKKSVKDVVVKDDFEVSVFLTDVGTRHALMIKRKTFESNGEDKNDDSASIIPREDSDEIDLDQIPTAADHDEEELVTLGSRARPTSNQDSDDKKKLAFRTTYDGFTIWGKVLCLLVERKGGHGKRLSQGTGGQALMQEWITATQQQRDEENG